MLDEIRVKNRVLFYCAVSSFLIFNILEYHSSQIQAFSVFQEFCEENSSEILQNKSRKNRAFG